MGYTLADPQRAQSRGATAVVLLRGATAVLFAQPPNTAVAEIEVWGAAQRQSQRYSKPCRSSCTDSHRAVLQRAERRCSITRAPTMGNG